MQEGLRQQKRQTWFDFLVTLAGKQEWANVLEYFMSRHICAKSSWFMDQSMSKIVCVIDNLNDS